MGNFKYVINPHTSRLQKVVSEEYITSLVTGGSSIVTVGSAGADYDNFDDAIDYLRTINGGTIIVITNMTITSTAVKDITNINIEGDLFFGGMRQLNKTVSSGYWYGKNVIFKDIIFYRISDTGANEIFKFTEDFQDVTLKQVTYVGLSAFSSPVAFNCNGKESHIVCDYLCGLGTSDWGAMAFSNVGTLVLHLYNKSSVYLTGESDACFIDSSCTITGNPTFSTSDHPFLVDKASGMDNDSSVTGDTVKEALETLGGESHTQNTDTALGAQSENLDMNTHKIVGLVDPTTDQEAATKKYTDTKDNTTDIALSTVTVAETTVETLIFTALVPSNSLVVGDVLKLYMSGTVDEAAAADEVTIRVKFGGVTIATIVSPGTGVTAKCWHVEGFATLRSIGETGIMAWHLDMNAGGETSGVCGIEVVNTTISANITATVEWNAEKANNIFTLTQGHLGRK